MKRIGALEAGGTKMVLACGNENGEIYDRVSIPTLTPAETMPEIAAYFKSQKIDALGIACFGPIDVRPQSEGYGTILMTPKIPWRRYHIVKYLREELQVPIRLDTDVNGSAIGEHRFGAGRDVDSLLYITIGTGIGIGVIIDGKPLHGALHPEGGHILMQRIPGDDFTCNCPNHDCCFEGMAAGPSIEKRWGKKAFELAEDPRVWALESSYIAQAITDYIMTLSPERIILGGGVMKQTQLFPLIREKTIDYIHGYLVMPELQDIEHYIVPAGCGEDQGILGCIAMASNL